MSPGLQPINLLCFHPDAAPVATLESQVSTLCGNVTVPSQAGYIYFPTKLILGTCQKQSWERVTFNISLLISLV